jgi:hypothetical protein
MLSDCGDFYHSHSTMVIPKKAQETGKIKDNQSTESSDIRLGCALLATKLIG